MSDADVSAELGQSEAEVQPVQQEKMIPQSDVTRAVVAAKKRAEEEAAAKYASMMQSQGATVDEDAVVEKAMKKLQAQLEAKEREAQQREQEAKLDAAVDSYLQRMKQGPELYEDFEEVTKGFRPEKYPQVAIVSTEFENTPDIIYELKKNPQKLATLQMYALNEDYDGLRDEMGKLSKSIKQNAQSLAKAVKTPQPLTKLKTSATAGQDTGKRTISDMRKDPRFKV